jgi:ubiquitin C-terminal hydrolase
MSPRVRSEVHGAASSARATTARVETAEGNQNQSTNNASEGGAEERATETANVERPPAPEREPPSSPPRVVAAIDLTADDDDDDDGAAGAAAPASARPGAEKKDESPRGDASGRGDDDDDDDETLGVIAFHIEQRQLAKRRSAYLAKRRSAYAAARAEKRDVDGGAGSATDVLATKKKRRPWTPPEVEALVEGVAHYGCGQWADIKSLQANGVAAALASRSRVDLKDKWRTLLPIAMLPVLDKRREATEVPATTLARVRELGAQKGAPPGGARGGEPEVAGSRPASDGSSPAAAVPKGARRRPRKFAVCPRDPRAKRKTDKQCLRGVSWWYFNTRSDDGSDCDHGGSKINCPLCTQCDHGVGYDVACDECDKLGYGVPQESCELLCDVGFLSHERVVAMLTDKKRVKIAVADVDGKVHYVELQLNDITAGAAEVIKIKHDRYNVDVECTKRTLVPVRVAPVDGGDEFVTVKAGALSKAFGGEDNANANAKAKARFLTSYRGGEMMLSGRRLAFEEEEGDGEDGEDREGGDAQAADTADDAPAQVRRSSRVANEAGPALAARARLDERAADDRGGGRAAGMTGALPDDGRDARTIERTILAPSPPGDFTEEAGPAPAPLADGGLGDECGGDVREIAAGAREGQEARHPLGLSFPRRARSRTTKTPRIPLPPCYAQHEFVTELGLTTLDQFAASLELYGYWLGDGWLDLSSRCIAFAPKKVKDWTYLDRIFWRLRGVLGDPAPRGRRGQRRGTNAHVHVEERPETVWRTETLPDGYIRRYESSVKCRAYLISNPAWFFFFYREYFEKYIHSRWTEAAAAEREKFLAENERIMASPPADGVGRSVAVTPGGKIRRMIPTGVASAKWVHPCVWRTLGKGGIRCILRGWRFADGDQSNAFQNSEDCGKIYTSCAVFRDECVQLAIHGGYAADFRLRMEKGHRLAAPDDPTRTIVARHDGWAVRYSDSAVCAEPNLEIDAFSARPGVAPVWSVNVPPRRWMMARQVYERDETTGRARKVARPYLVAGRGFFGDSDAGGAGASEARSESFDARVWQSLCVWKARDDLRLPALDGRGTRPSRSSRAQRRTRPAAPPKHHMHPTIDEQTFLPGDVYRQWIEDHSDTLVPDGRGRPADDFVLVDCFEKIFLLWARTRAKAVAAAWCYAPRRRADVMFRAEPEAPEAPGAAPATAAGFGPPVASNPVAAAAKAAARRLAGTAPEGRSETPEHAPRGLVNLGNTCFAAACLQALAHTPPLAGLVLLKSAERNASEVVKEFARVVRAIHRSDDLHSSVDAYNPHKFMNALKSYDTLKEFTDGQQHDSQEFLWSLVNELDPNALDPYLNEGMVNVFAGELRNTVTCKECNTASPSPERFLNLSLPLRESVTDCLDAFTAVEDLGDEDKVHCSKCNKLCEARKKVLVKSCPQVLVLHLKRFRWDGVLSHKIDTAVRVPQTLSLSPYLAEGAATANGGGEAKYELFAVINHVNDFGSSMKEGHYTATADAGAGTGVGKWYAFDDEHVSSVRDGPPKSSSNAYVLFYANSR